MASVVTIINRPGCLRGGKQVTAGAQLAQTGGDEHGNDGAGGVAGVNDVGLVTQGPNEVAQLQPRRGLGPVAAGVDDLGIDAGNVWVAS